jgi:hypothetical protein
MVAETSCEFNDKLVFHLDCQVRTIICSFAPRFISLRVHVATAFYESQ